MAFKTSGSTAKAMSRSRSRAAVVRARGGDVAVERLGARVGGAARESVGVAPVVSSSSSSSSSSGSKRLVARKKGSSVADRGRARLRRELLRETRSSSKRLRRSGRRSEPVVEGPLTEGQKEYVKVVSRETGLSPRVVAAQALAEMSGSHAAKREAEGNHNWGNIAYFDSGPGAITKDQTWSDPKSAGHATADFFKGKRFGASQGIRDVLKSAGGSEEEQIQALANSGWASSGYEGGDSLRGTAALISVGEGDPQARRGVRRSKRSLRRVERRAGAAGLPGVAKRARRARKGSGGSSGSSSGLWEQKPGTGRNKPDLSGVDVSSSSKDIVSLGRTISRRSGRPLEITSADRPGASTVSGNTSDHSSGNALDIAALAVSEGGTPEQERQGNQVAFHAVRAAGGSVEQAKQLARDGGALTLQAPNGRRVQVIWKSNVGGNHYNHVHVGVGGGGGGSSYSPGGGSVAAGSPSAGATYDSGAVAAVAEARGISVKEARRLLDEEPMSGLAILRQLGFTITPGKVSSPGGGRSKPKAGIGKLRKKYLAKV